MGENYLHEQVENSKKRRNQARQDLDRPKLFTRPDLTDVTYDLVPVGNEHLHDGEKLLVIAATDREEVDVLRNNVRVATIRGDGQESSIASSPSPRTAARFLYLHQQRLEALRWCRRSTHRGVIYPHMDRLATRRAELRPHGITNIPCKRCYFFDDCGGIETNRPLLTCFDEHCCNKVSCDWVCPNHRASFAAHYREINGFGTDDIDEIRHTPVTLPIYIPVVDHRSRRNQTLEWPFVSLNTYRVIRPHGDNYLAVANSSHGLRETFGLSPSTNIILRGVAKDPPLEAYWHYRRSHNAPEQLAALGVTLAVGPNFSHFLNVPRTDNLFNRKRQLVCLQELSRAGLCAVPHLSAVVPADWEFWKTFLDRNPLIYFVAKEFETGNKDPNEGRKAVGELARLQDSIGRRLHPILIGAAQFIADAAVFFDALTVIDSTPFIKAMFRKGFGETQEDGRWYDSYSLKRQAIDSLLTKNLKGYSAWLESLVAASRIKLGARCGACPGSFHR